MVDALGGFKVACAAAEVLNRRRSGIAEVFGGIRNGKNIKLKNILDPSRAETHHSSMPK